MFRIRRKRVLARRSFAGKKCTSTSCAAANRKLPSNRATAFPDYFFLLTYRRRVFGPGLNRPGMFCAALRFPTTFRFGRLRGCCTPPERNFQDRENLGNKRYCEFFAVASLSYGRTVLHFLCTISPRREFSVSKLLRFLAGFLLLFFLSLFLSSSSRLVLQLSKQSDSNDAGQMRYFWFHFRALYCILNCRSSMQSEGLLTFIVIVQIFI